LNKIRVYIPTTDGPVAIERITREPAAQSAVCVKRTTRVLPISAAYDAFVRAPSGVIEREFGPFETGAFRLDVSAAIGDGESWQLGVYLAHALAVEGRLAGPDDDCVQAIWATGAVDSDLRINSVSHVSEKIHLSQELVAELETAGIAVSAFVPLDNEAIADNTAAGFDIAAVDATHDILTSLQAAPSAVPTAPVVVKPATAVPPTSGSRGIVAVWIVLGLNVFAAASWYLSQADVRTDVAPKVAAVEPEPPTRSIATPVEKTSPAPVPKPEIKKAVTPLTVGIAELRAPAGSHCAAVQFGTVKPLIVPLAGTGPKRTDSRVEGLCGLEFSIATGDVQRYARVEVAVRHGKLLKVDGLPAGLSGQTAFEGRKAWRVHVPKRLPRALEYTLNVSFGDKPVDLQTTSSITVSHRITP
jgi:hypothetical protein